MLSRHTFVMVDYATISQNLKIKDIILEIYKDIYKHLEKASPEKDKSMNEFINLRNSVFDVAHMSRQAIYDKLYRNTDLDLELDLEND